MLEEEEEEDEEEEEEENDDDNDLLDKIMQKIFVNWNNIG